VANLTLIRCISPSWNTYLYWC